MRDRALTDLIEAQIASERLSLAEGRLRFLKEQERITKDKGFGSREDVTRLLRQCLPRVSQVIESTLKTTLGERKRYGKLPLAYSLLSTLDIDLLALIGLSRCFSGVAGQAQGSLTGVVAFTGKAVEDELWAKALREKDAKLYERLVIRATKTHGSVAYRRKAIRATAAKEGFKIEPFTNEVRVKLGEPLVNAVLVACPDIFETYLFDKGKGQTQRSIGLTKEASDALSLITDAMGWMQPVFKPMLVQPDPWARFNTGAYLTPELKAKVPLVRTYDRKHIKVVKEAIKSGQMKPCLDALNIIQNTAWRINRRVFEIMVEAYERGIDIEGFPRREHIKKPERPADYDNLPDNLRKGWRIQAAQVALRNRGIDGDRVTFVQDLAVAQSLVQADRFYLPHSLDFRGRVYPVPHFNTQRADHIKACFEFADGVALGVEGEKWLMIHLANCGDFDKISKKSFQERVDWVIENEDLIKAIAASPWQHVNVWTKADKPFQFLAACIDYADFLQNGLDHVSHLPVALDGSNSGLQHYSAALRSFEGRLVNLVPSEAPEDIYQRVADAALAFMQEDDSDIAKLVVANGVNRKLVKRNAMTFAYSSEEYGFRQQHMDDLMKPLALKVLNGELERHPYGDDGGFRAASYIAKKTWAAITSIVSDACVGMRFFQRCAQVLAHEGKGLSWVTPVGLPVTHRYTEWDTKIIKMFLFDKNVPVEEAGPADRIVDDQVHKQVRVTVRTEPKKRINKSKAKSAVAPNVIHSLDASHLMLTVLAAAKEGIDSFSLIHDSFGTHAARTSDFFYIIREAFVDMYQNYCPFEEIYAQTFAAIDDKSKVPSTPTKGGLDVALVNQSLYAFA
jgi:DNA-directed RNA polymerase